MNEANTMPTDALVSNTSKFRPEMSDGDRLVAVVLEVNTLRPRQHFQMYFLEWKCMNFDLNFTEICSKGSN